MRAVISVWGFHTSKAEHPNLAIIFTPTLCWHLLNVVGSQCRERCSRNCVLNHFPWYLTFLKADSFVSGFYQFQSLWIRRWNYLLIFFTELDFRNNHIFSLYDWNQITLSKIHIFDASQEKPGLYLYLSVGTGRWCVYRESRLQSNPGPTKIRKRLAVTNVIQNWLSLCHKRLSTNVLHKSDVIAHPQSWAHA